MVTGNGREIGLKEDGHRSRGKVEREKREIFCHSDRQGLQGKRDRERTRRGGMHIGSCFYGQGQVTWGHQRLVDKAMDGPWGICR